MYKDLKYLLAYLLPLAGYLGLYYGGVWSYGSIYVAFVALPLLEFVLPGTSENHAPEEEPVRAARPIFNWLLYLNLPILAGAVVYLLYVVSARELATYELVGMILNVGLMIGTIGINVGHELGHRSNKAEQFLAKALLMFGLYMQRRWPLRAGTADPQLEQQPRTRSYFPVRTSPPQRSPLPGFAEVPDSEGLRRIPPTTDGLPGLHDHGPGASALVWGDGPAGGYPGAAGFRLAGPNLTLP